MSNAVELPVEMTRTVPDVVSMPMRSPAASTPLTPMAMLGQAIAQGAGIETLEKLMALQERWEVGQARKAFDAALAAAKAEIPVIAKNRTVDFVSQKGRTHYRHADLGEIMRTIDPILGRHGLSCRFRTISDQGGVAVTCIVSHREGHSEENTLSSGRDESGNKNHIQAIGSAITYLQRYTLMASLGLAASIDDDGRAASPGGNGSDAPVTDEQAETIRKLAIEVNASVVRLLKHYNAESLTSIRARDFPDVIAKLEAKRAADAARTTEARP